MDLEESITVEEDSYSSCDDNTIDDESEECASCCNPTCSKDFLVNDINDSFRHNRVLRYRALSCDSCTLVYCGNCYHLFFDQQTINGGEEEARFICTKCKEEDMKLNQTPNYQVCPECYCSFLDSNGNSMSCICMDDMEEEDVVVADNSTDCCYTCHCNYCNNNDRIRVGSACPRCHEIHEGNNSKSTLAPTETSQGYKCNH
jgi:hypothetical protein